MSFNLTSFDLRSNDLKVILHNKIYNVNRCKITQRCACITRTEDSCSCIKYTDWIEFNCQAVTKLFPDGFNNEHFVTDNYISAVAATLMVLRVTYSQKGEKVAHDGYLYRRTGKTEPDYTCLLDLRKT